jgi:hypothetical protein
MSIITIWVVGYLFFLGVLYGSENDSPGTIEQAVMSLVGLVLWPALLGISYRAILDHYDYGGPEARADQRPEQTRGPSRPEFRAGQRHERTFTRTTV